MQDAASPSSPAQFLGLPEAASLHLPTSAILGAPATLALLVSGMGAGRPVAAAALAAAMAGAAAGNAGAVMAAGGAAATSKPAEAAEVRAAPRYPSCTTSYSPSAGAQCAAARCLAVPQVPPCKGCEPV
jgi:hypothetical protein